MKKSFVLSAVFFGFCTLSFSQDIITLRNGDDIEAKVLEIDSRTVKYRLFGEPDGVIYVLDKSELLIIRYENGRKEVFADQSEDNLFAPQSEPEKSIVPGMKYRELKHLYKASDYVSTPGDPYLPGVSGVLSFLIPGLGQMVCDEVGRGFGYLGGSVGLALLTGIGAGYSYMSTGAAIVALVGSVGWITLDVIAIVDAVKVAKVKNMYVQDMRNKYSIDVNMLPSVDYIPTGNGMQPTIGLTVALNF